MRAAQPNQPGAPRLASRLASRLTLIRMGLALIVIACGLSLRWFGFPLGLPAFVVKYGGSLLWATMVLLLVRALLPRLGRAKIAAIAMAIAVLVELSRLVHAPWLDAFRLTTAGALLLGRIFSLWNVVAYVAGILVGAWLDRFVDRFVGWAKAPWRRAHHLS